MTVSLATLTPIPGTFSAQEIKEFILLLLVLLLVESV